MGTRLSIALVGLVLAALGRPLAGQDEDFHVYTDAPRLLLTKQRLRLLQRERERESTRWQQFDGLVATGAPMPEAALFRRSITGWPGPRPPGARRWNGRSPTRPTPSPI